MSDAVALIQQYQNLIYVGIGLGAVWYLRALLRAQRRLRFSVFGLERETYAAARTRALVMLIFIAAAGVLVFYAGRIDAASLDTLGRRVATPDTGLITAVPTTIIEQPFLLPGQPSPTPAGTPTPAPENTPVPAGSLGCQNPRATISSPLPGAVIAGQVEVVGAADIDNFAFYVLEISTLGDNWLTVVTSNTPVNQGVLGTWDSSLQSAGNYGFRLIVYDASGAFQEPCVIPITIGGSP